MSAVYLIVGILLGMFAYWLLQDARPFRYHSRYAYGQSAPYRSWEPPTRPAPAYDPYAWYVRRELPALARCRAVVDCACPFPIS
jgi:hypothetical protein